MNQKTNQFDCRIVTKPDHCHPHAPCPVPQEETCKGTISLDCHCPRLFTRTFVQNIGPQTEPALRANVQTTANAWEAGGYVVQALNVLDTGAGWMLTLTVGWYA